MVSRFLFGYGSLVSPASAAATLGRAISVESGPHAAVLSGWERSWNVATGRHSHPERRLVEDSGREFTGVLAVLGVVPAPGRLCTGAVYEVGDRDLLLLDGRERNYLRADVTGRVDWAGRPAGCQVFTYLPRPASVRLLSAAASGEAVIRRQYADLVDSAFRSLGEEELETYRTTTLPTDLPLRPLRLEWPATPTQPGAQPT